MNKPWLLPTGQLVWYKGEAIDIYSVLENAQAEVEKLRAELKQMRQRYYSLEALSTIADSECICTPEQQTGEDSTLCPVCTAAQEYNFVMDSAYNSVMESAREKFRHLDCSK